VVEVELLEVQTMIKQVENLQVLEVDQVLIYLIKFLQSQKVKQ
jgi:hypothetical protein